MSDFLTLVQALHLEVGAAGVAPTSVVGQTGEAARLVRWVSEADYKISSKWVNWKFLRSEFTVGNVTTAGIATLAKPATLKTWELNTFKIVYPGDPTRYQLPAYEFEELKSYIFDTQQGVPSFVVVMPDNSLRFDPVPDAAYTIIADYYRKPVKLAANIDVPAMPEEHHDSAILGRAMMYYANFEDAPEIKIQGQELYSEGLAELETHQLPNRNYARQRTGGHFQVVGGQYGDMDDFGSF